MIELRPGGSRLTLALLEDCRISQNSRVLDIGCGNGETISLLKSKFGCRATGVEPDRAKAARAESAFPGARIVETRAEELPFDGQSFDLVIAECAASLFEQPELAFAQIRRVLCPGGRLVLSDVYARAAAPPAAKGLLRRLYTMEEFISLLNRAGFKIIFCKDCGDILKGILGQLVFEYGTAEAYRIIGLEQCAALAADLGYLALAAERAGEQEK